MVSPHKQRFEVVRTLVDKRERTIFGDFVRMSFVDAPISSIY